MSAYDTVSGILSGHISSDSGANASTSNRMLVQSDPLVTEDDYQIRYVTVYNPHPGVSNVEAYVLIKDSGISFYDFNSHEIYTDDTFIGQRSDITALDDLIAEYNLERGRNMGSPGAGDALYAALKGL